MNFKTVTWLRKHKETGRVICLCTSITFLFYYYFSPIQLLWWIWRRQSSTPNLSLWTNSFLGSQAECHYSVTWLYVWKDCVCFYIVFHTPLELRRCYRSIWKTSIQLSIVYLCFTVNIWIITRRFKDFKIKIIGNNSTVLGSFSSLKIVGDELTEIP